MKTRKICSLLTSLALLTTVAGCIKPSSHIRPSYVSHLRYENYTCQDIEVEMEQLNLRLLELVKKQNEAAMTDTVGVAAGVAFYWPALLVLATTKDETEAISTLRGQAETLHGMAVRKKCQIAAVDEKNQRFRRYEFDQ